jgi:hypothetical protein
MKFILIQWLSFSIVFIIFNIIFIGPLGLILSGGLILIYYNYCAPSSFDTLFRNFRDSVNGASILILSVAVFPYLYYTFQVYDLFDVGGLPIFGQAARRVAIAYFDFVPKNGVQYIAAQVYGGSYIANTIIVAVSFPLFAHHINFKINKENINPVICDIITRYNIFYVSLFLQTITYLRMYDVGRGSENSNNFFEIVTFGSLFTGPVIYILPLISVTMLYLSRACTGCR